MGHPLISPIEILPECAADTIQSDGIHATVHKRQTEADNPEEMPERVVVLRSIGTANKTNKKCKTHPQKEPRGEAEAITQCKCMQMGSKG